MSITQNVCTICSTKNELEAVVCRQCGATLDDPFLDPGAKTKTSDMPAVSAESFREGLRAWQIEGADAPARGIAIYVEGELQPTHVDSRGEIVIGRKAGMSSDVSLDLAPAGGYHLGLSRRHAVIRWGGEGYEVLDLGSVNGTWLNEERLLPHKAYPLPSGSHLRLASMRLFVLYRLSSS